MTGIARARACSSLGVVAATPMTRWVTRSETVPTTCAPTRSAMLETNAFVFASTCEQHTHTGRQSRRKRRSPTLTTSPDLSVCSAFSTLVAWTKEPQRDTSMSVSAGTGMLPACAAGVPAGSTRSFACTRDTF